MATPLVALQKPKDISLDEIEAELRNIWRSQSDGSSAPGATRATTFSMVIYEPEEIQQRLAALSLYKEAIDGEHGPATKAAVTDFQKAYNLRITGRVDTETLARLREECDRLPPDRLSFKNSDIRGFTFSESLAAQNPCRVITLCPILGEDTGVTAQVSAYCPVQKNNTSNLICCEYITLRGTKSALERVGDLVESLIVSDLPKFVWWKATPNEEQPLFRSLAASSSCVILDSSYFSDAAAELPKIKKLIDSGTNVADLNWYRLAPWQELTASSFDPPERRVALMEVDQVSIDYENGNPAQALMYLGWMASRLDWQPEAYKDEGGDYDIQRIRFSRADGRQIETELAAVPIADWGEILGDLTGLRLSSTNPEANCCTVLCSETVGCMRMESGGGAQSCLFQEVTALSDQRSDLLLGQQLQRWGEDVLFEESLAVATEILQMVDA
ncbi:glucose-6-phosphate dehydrogenase assembly protein OpcA [Romeria aff. gracilis LEGE 07310]|uniref:Glucose-6-phosphate dehydrogenase assembly protein OpcA n=1 Tax=Vasconcelosia minhoensis LEGE 07310 TaxID=915328 RepID=A0A8J7AHK0_9CYAN|nr:glucose-6-phosphate dehydrogenase assembly protein OpcA [Romeria gracilis]MBE9077683.1 glucose-6-phosphate dehydrogenase assembly protein OpcA [Romeria aff. gracilis LEGE 07310]